MSKEKKKFKFEKRHFWFAALAVLVAIIFILWFIVFD
jgi:hypothetical protein